MRVLLLGIGNPLRKDDGVGIHVARKLKNQLKGIDVLEVCGCGLDLLEIIKGYDLVFIIDAMKTGRYKVGDFCKFSPEEFDHQGDPLSSHTFDLFTLIRLGQKLIPDQMPQKVILYGIEVADATTLFEGLSQRLQEELPSTINRLKREIQGCATTDPGNSET